MKHSGGGSTSRNDGGRGSIDGDVVDLALLVLLVLVERALAHLQAHTHTHIPV